MANPSLETIQLQMAMAFGQGAGSMLAAPEALDWALSKNNDLVKTAASDWKATQHAFIGLLRVAGQVAAAKAAAQKMPEIDQPSIEYGISVVLSVCPCRLSERR